MYLFNQHLCKLCLSILNPKSTIGLFVNNDNGAVRQRARGNFSDYVSRNSLEVAVTLDCSSTSLAISLSTWLGCMEAEGYSEMTVIKFIFVHFLIFPWFFLFDVNCYNIGMYICWYI